MAEAEPKQTRDRAATEARILDAAEDILVRLGPSGFGVNAVARAAGVDKQLIYRYFNGLEGLLEALGDRIAVWWQDQLSEDAPVDPATRYGDVVERLALRLLTIMRTQPLAQQAALWELTGDSAIVRPFSQAKARALGAWVARVRGTVTPPPDVDAPAVNAMIIAAVSYMVLAGRSSDHVIGLPVAAENHWQRIEAALQQLVRGAYGE